MKSSIKQEILGKVMASASRGSEVGALTLLVANVGEDLRIGVGAFPLKMAGGRRLELNSPALEVLERAGVITKSEGLICLDREAVLHFLCEKAKEFTTTSEFNSKNSTTSKFVFEAGHPSQKPLAFFMGAFGSRVRKGLVDEVADLEHETAQLVIHEMVASELKGKVEEPISYAVAIVRKAKVGAFRPSRGLKLADALDVELSQGGGA